MTVYFSKTADKQLKDWVKSNKAIAIKIYELIKDIQDNGFMTGKGKPEKLKHYKDPVRFSRRITIDDRLVYCLYNENDLIVISCKGHYDDK